MGESLDDWGGIPSGGILLTPSPIRPSLPTNLHPLLLLFPLPYLHHGRGVSGASPPSKDGGRKKESKKGGKEGTNSNSGGGYSGEVVRLHGDSLSDRPKLLIGGGCVSGHRDMRAGFIL